MYRQCIGVSMGTNCAVYLANFYSFPRSLIFFKCLLKCNSCPVVLQTLFLACRFVDDHFIVDFLDRVMYLDLDSFGGRTYPKISCELNCTSNGFTCYFLDLT